MVTPDSKQNVQLCKRNGPRMGSLRPLSCVYMGSIVPTLNRRHIHITAANLQGGYRRQLNCLCWFVSARVLHHPHLQYFIRAKRDFDETTDFARAALNAKKQLRGAVPPMDSQREMFFDVLHDPVKRSPDPLRSRSGLLALCRRTARKLPSNRADKLNAWRLVYFQNETAPGGSS